MAARFADEPRRRFLQETLFYEPLVVSPTALPSGWFCNPVLAHRRMSTLEKQTAIDIPTLTIPTSACFSTTGMRRKKFFTPM